MNEIEDDCAEGRLEGVSVGPTFKSHSAGADCSKLAGPTIYRQQILLFSGQKAGHGTVSHGHEGNFPSGFERRQALTRISSKGSLSLTHRYRTAHPPWSLHRSCKA